MTRDPHCDGCKADEARDALRREVATLTVERDAARSELEHARGRLEAGLAVVSPPETHGYRLCCQRCGFALGCDNTFGTVVSPCMNCAGPMAFVSPETTP